MEQTNKLTDAIENLYRSFAKYANWSENRGCEHCIDESTLHPLVDKSLRDLSHTDLSPYAENALLLWGDENDFKHFLPRLFELCTVPAKTDCWWEVETIVGGRLAQAKLKEWPNSEQKAVEDFLTAWWEEILTQSANRLPVSEFLAAISHVHKDITPLLVEWRTYLTESAFFKLAESWWFLEGNIIMSEEQLGQANNWLNDPATVEWVAEGCKIFRSADWCRQLDLGLRKLKSAR